MSAAGMLPPSRPNTILTRCRSSLHIVHCYRDASHSTEGGSSNILDSQASLTRSLVETDADTANELQLSAVGRDIIQAQVTPRELQEEHSTNNSTSIPNFSRRIVTRQNSTASMESRRSSSCAPGLMQNVNRSQRVKRWDGATRTFTNWDGLRKVTWLMAHSINGSGLTSMPGHRVVDTQR